MKKKIILAVVAVLLVVALTACNTNEPSNEPLENESNKSENKGSENDVNDDAQIEYEVNEEGIIKPKFAQKIIEEEANKIINAISNKDVEVVSQFVHPIKGVRFTPYTYVSEENDIVFNQEQMKNFFNDQNVYLWGYYDGSGNEISLTPSQYYDEFIYTADFINAEKIGYNEVLSSGNMLENQFEVYEDPIVVEYYFSGFDPEFEGIDWQSLRLVFEQNEDSWKLVGIIHNQWTI